MAVSKLFSPPNKGGRPRVSGVCVNKRHIGDLMTACDSSQWILLYALMTHPASISCMPCPDTHFSAQLHNPTPPPTASSHRLSQQNAPTLLGIL